MSNSKIKIGTIIVTIGLIASMIGIYTFLSSEIEDLTTTNQNLTEGIRDLTKGIDDLTEENLNLKEQVERLKTENKKLREPIEGKHLSSISQVIYTAYDEGAEPPIWSGWMGSSNGASLTVDTTSIETDAHNGSFSARITYDPAKESWAGVFVQSDGTWEGGQGIGLNLTATKTLSFYAKGTVGGEKVKFGYGYSGKDSSAKVTEFKTLSTQWTQFVIDLSGEDISHINGVFMFTVDRTHNPSSITFYIDNIQYQ